jgi:hypothetical protein
MPSSSTSSTNPVPAYVKATWAPGTNTINKDSKINSSLPPQVYLDQTSFTKYCSTPPPFGVPFEVKQNYNSSTSTFTYGILSKCPPTSVSTVSCTLQLQTPNPQNPLKYSQFKCNNNGDYLNLKYPTSNSIKVSFYCGDSLLTIPSS